MSTLQSSSRIWHGTVKLSRALLLAVVTAVVSVAASVAMSAWLEPPRVLTQNPVVYVSDGKPLEVGVSVADVGSTNWQQLITATPNQRISILIAAKNISDRTIPIVTFYMSDPAPEAPLVGGSAVFTDSRGVFSVGMKNALYPGQNLSILRPGDEVQVQYEVIVRQTKSCANTVLPVYALFISTSFSGNLTSNKAALDILGPCSPISPPH